MRHILYEFRLDPFATRKLLWAMFDKVMSRAWHDGLVSPGTVCVDHDEPILEILGAQFLPFVHSDWSWTRCI